MATATPLGHPEPRGQSVAYMEILERELGFTCSLETAVSCARAEEGVEYTVDISASPIGEVHTLFVFVIAEEPTVDLRTNTDAVADHVAAIARPLLRSDAEVEAIQQALRTMIGAWPPDGEIVEFERIEVGVSCDGDPGKRSGAEAFARVTFTDVVVPEP